jgi:hypothetical protein
MQMNFSHTIKTAMVRAVTAIDLTQKGGFALVGTWAGQQIVPGANILMITDNIKSNVFTVRIQIDSPPGYTAPYMTLVFVGRKASNLPKPYPYQLGAQPAHVLATNMEILAHFSDFPGCDVIWGTPNFLSMYPPNQAFSNSHDAWANILSAHFSRNPSIVINKPSVTRMASNCSYRAAIFILAAQLASPKTLDINEGIKAGVFLPIPPSSSNYAAIPVPTKYAPVSGGKPIPIPMPDAPPVQKQDGKGVTQIRLDYVDGIPRTRAGCNQYIQTPEGVLITAITNKSGEVSLTLLGGLATEIEQIRGPDWADVLSKQADLLAQQAATLRILAQVVLSTPRPDRKKKAKNG